MFNRTVEIERNILEQSYEGTMSVCRKVSQKNNITKETKTIDSTIYENKPCALSQKDLSKTYQNSEIGNITYVLKIFCAPELIILPGDQITVSQNGMVYELKHTGEPFVYPTHQEIIVEREEKA